MKIKTRMQVSVLLVSILALITGFVTLRIANHLIQENDKILCFDEIRTDVAGLDNVLDEYLLYHEQRAWNQCLQKYQTLQEKLSKEIFVKQEEIKLFEIIRHTHKQLKPILDHISLSHNKWADIEEKDRKIIQAHKKVLAGQLSVKSHIMLSAAHQLHLHKKKKQNEILQESMRWILMLLGGIVLVVVIDILWVYNRVVPPIARLQKGAKTLASGNMKFKMGSKKRDEVGQLSQAFDHMAERLQIVTVSREDLVREVDERKRVNLRIEKLNHLKEELLKPAPLNEKLNRITECVVELFQGDFARIWITKPSDLCASGCVHADVKEGPHVCRNRNKCLHLKASSGRYTYTDGSHRRIPFDCGNIGRLASGQDRKFIINDALNDSLAHDKEWAKELGLGFFAGYPLQSQTDTPLGLPISHK